MKEKYVLEVDENTEVTVNVEVLLLHEKDLHIMEAMVEENLENIIDQIFFDDEKKDFGIVLDFFSIEYADGHNQMYGLRGEFEILKDGNWICEVFEEEFTLEEYANYYKD